MVQAKRSGESGFTLIQAAVLILILGMLLAPVFSFITRDLGSEKKQQTREVVEVAREALIAYAARNNGCLPFAADFEGGRIDTDATGAAAAGYADTGKGVANQHAGDLPWADLGLGSYFLDGERNRLQYFVAGQYTDSDADPTNGITCNAGFRGFPFGDHPGIAIIRYFATPSLPQYVYFTKDKPKSGEDPRQLCKFTETFFEDEPKTKSGKVLCVTNPLPSALLEVRRGPNVIGASPESDVISVQNVFVLIVAATNRNTVLDRRHVRDSNHLGDELGTPLAANAANVDTAVFSSTRDTTAADEGDHGDDKLVYTSFDEFQQGLAKFGLHLEPYCETAC